MCLGRQKGFGVSGVSETEGVWCARGRVEKRPGVSGVQRSGAVCCRGTVEKSKEALRVLRGDVGQVPPGAEAGPLGLSAGETEVTGSDRWSWGRRWTARV